jgi:hypothetical protein
VSFVTDDCLGSSHPDILAREPTKFGHLERLSSTAKRLEQVDKSGSFWISGGQSCKHQPIEWLVRSSSAFVLEILKDCQVAGETFCCRYRSSGCTSKPSGSAHVVRGISDCAPVDLLDVAAPATPC